MPDFVDGDGTPILDIDLNGKEEFIYPLVGDLGEWGVYVGLYGSWNSNTQLEICSREGLGLVYLGYKEMEVFVIRLDGGVIRFKL
nr:hypothetical protein [Tanacetum cinerariifolium]